MKLYLSNRLEALYELLKNDLKKFDFGYQSPYLIIPNFNTRNWLTEKIAEDQNIFMGYEFYPFEIGLYKILNHFAKDRDYVLIDDDLFSIALYSVITNLDEELTEIKQYYHDHQFQQGNIYGLCFYLTKIFIDYLSHNEAIYNYFHNFNEKESEVNYLLKEQKKVFQKTKEYLKQLLKKNPISIYFYTDEFINLFNRYVNVKQPIFLFGFTSINLLELKILKKLNPLLDIYFYHPILYDYSSEKTYEHFVQDISKNTVELIKEVLGKDLKEIVYRPLFSQKKSVFQIIQDTFFEKGIYQLDKDNFENISDFPINIDFYKVPSIKEEVKNVISQIQKDLLNDPELRLNEIAILAPEIKKYLPILEGMLSHLNIPYVVQLSNLEGRSSLIDGIISVLNLYENYENNRKIFSRRLILEILQNDLFQNTYGINYDFMNRLFRVLNRTNVYNDHMEDYYHSWDLFFKRLRAGNYLDEQFYFEDQAGEKVLFPYKDFEFTNEDIEILHHSLYQLIEDIKTLYQKVKENLNEFYNFLDEIIYKNFIKYNNNISSIDIKIYQEYKKYLFYLRELKIQPSGHFLKNYFYLMLNKVYNNIKKYNLNGVILANIRYSEMVPFKNVYIMGLTMEDFPGKSDLDSFNFVYEMLTDEKHKKNILNERQVNEFFFYQIFFSTQNKIVFSYQYLDIENKKDLYPSYVYSDLLNSLNDLKSLHFEREKKIIYDFQFYKDRIFINMFEFYNLLLIYFRNDFSSLKKLSFFHEILQDPYISEIYQKENENIYKDAKELYEENKFPNEFVNLVSEPKKINIVRLRSLINFFSHPIKEYFKVNQLLSFEYEQELDENKEIPDLNISKYILYSISKDYLYQYLKYYNQNEKIEKEYLLEKILISYQAKGFLNVIPESIRNLKNLPLFKNLFNSLESILIMLYKASDQLYFLKRLKLRDDGKQSLEEALRDKKGNSVILASYQLGNLQIIEDYSDFIIDAVNKYIYFFPFSSDISAEKKILFNFLSMKLDFSYHFKKITFDNDLKFGIKDFPINEGIRFDQSFLEQIMNYGLPYYYFDYQDLIKKNLLFVKSNMYDYSNSKDLTSLKEIVKQEYIELNKKYRNKNEDLFFKLYMDEFINL